MNLRRAAVPVAAAAVLALAPAALAGHAFSASTTTAGGYHTWDSDLIDTELVSQTGAGVYVAVLDTGLVPNWPDYFPDERVAQELGAGFYQNITFKAHSQDGCELDTEIGPLKQVSYLGSRGSSHGTHVASTIIGYNYRSNADLTQGFNLPAIQVRGIAPDATIIPVRVLADYQVPALPKCEDPTPSGLQVFGTSEMVAAGIDYVTSLNEGVLADHPVVINMSLGSDPDVEIVDVEREAVDRAIAAGVIVVAAAGNDGEAGMSAPGSYAPVISAGAAGWTGEWLDQETDPEGPDNGFRYRMFWLKNVMGNVAGTAGSLVPPLNAGSGDVSEGDASRIYVTDFSSREHAALDQDLDVLAPGSWVRGPFAGTPGFNHLPWWSKGFGDLFRNTGNFYYVGGTSMASPHVAAVAALMLQKNPDLTAAQVETILTTTAMDFGAGSAMVWDPFHVDADGNAVPAFVEFTWNADAVGEGVLQADAAVAATP
jgi:subtilisin family serine protease